MLPMVHTEPVLFDFGGPSIDGATTPSPSVPSSLTPHSDVDELVDIFFDVDVAVNTFSRVDSCDLQLGDTWRGMQGKMSVTAPIKKIKRKSDSKPQSQVNKCINEKRRRELENETINQLEELLGTCLAEVKQPDKNGIVREATRQIQEVLNRRRECPGECPLRARLEPVQAGEVSSTQPQPPPPGHHYSETTTLIEALKHYTSSLGWVLLEINSEGKIVCVTENIKDFILQDRTELYKKSIFSLLHARDHAKIKPLLKNIQSFGWSAGDSDKFQAIQARLAIHNSNGTDDADYVEAVIHAAPVRGSPAEQAGSVMCVIRRCEDASALLPAPLPTDGPPSRADIHNDQIVFRLDSNLVILTCDLSGVEDLVGTRYLELVDQSDRVRVAAHLKGAPGLSAPPSISDPFRLRLHERRLRVIAQTRIFRAEAASDDHDFIMSTHTVLDDDAPLDAGPAPAGAGGPLLPSAPNGEPYRPTMSPADFIAINDFDHDQWFSVPNFPMGDMSEESKETKGSPSPGPLTPLTPRTPATPGDAPPGPAGPADERLRSLLTKPVSEASSVASENRLLKNLLKQEEEDGTSSETSAPHTPLTPHTPHTPHTPAALSPHHSHTAGARALPHHPHAPHAPHAPHPQHAPHSSHMLQSQMSMSSAALHTLQPPINNGSEILSRILHTNSDEDAEENRRNSQDGNRPSQVSQPSALLTQLLANGPSNNGRSTDPERDYLHERLQGVKRKFEENKGCPTSNVKRPTSEAQQVSSSAASASPTCTSSATSPSTSSAGMSPLCAKNQILVSLLARQQTSPTTPMPLPNALRGFPAQRPRAPPPALPRHQATITNMLAANNNSRASNVNGGGAGSGLEMASAPSLGQSHLQLVLQGAPRGYPAPPAANPPPDPLHYGNTAPLHVYNNQPMSGSSRQGERGDSEVPCGDSMLSAILDEFIENMPDADRNAPDGMKDSKAMINAIRQSLMQCETVTKSPVSTSPGPPPPVYSVQNLGGGSMSGSNAAMYSMSGAGDPARRVGEQQQQKARLLQQQLQQQMLVSREASEQPQADLGSALVTGAPPNVTLQRTPDYHRLYISPSNQLGSNYGTNKITSTQQNPMLSQQLTGSRYSAALAAHSAAALHTPMSQQPYHRAPRPQPVGGYYDEGAGYCGEYAHARRPHAPHAPHVPHAPHGPHGSHAPHGPHAPMSPHTPHQVHPPPHDQVLSCAGSGGVGGLGGAGAGAGAGAGGTSEYVRNELRAVVGARSARPDPHPHQPPDLDPLMSFDMSTSSEYYGGGLGGGGGGSR